MHHVRRGIFRSIFTHPHLRFFTAEVGEGGSAGAGQSGETDPSGQAGDQPTGDGDGGKDDSTGTSDQDDEPLGEAGLKALQRERAAVKAEREARQQLEAKIQEFENAAKSDEEKKADAAEAERKQYEETAAELAQAKAMNLRYEVAAAKGIDMKLAGRLSGDSREALEKDADALLELIGTPRQPQPDRSAGRGGEPVKPRSLNEAIGQHYG